MNYYYLDADNRPAGPLPLDDICRKAAAGEIPANPMIAAGFMATWRRGRHRSDDLPGPR